MLERFPTLPILLYADQDTDQLAKETLRAGLSGYLFPPLRTDDIRHAVEHSLARARGLGDWLRREVKRTTSSLEERARLSEADLARYEAIFSTIQDGVIVLDTQNKVLFLNPAVREMYQVTEKEPAGKALLEVITHPDLRSLMGRASEEPLKYHEINLDSGQVLNAQFTPIPGIGADSAPAAMKARTRAASLANEGSVLSRATNKAGPVRHRLTTARRQSKPDCRDRGDVSISAACNA